MELYVALMTKVQALKQLMADNGGAASWSYIYEHIERYYPAAKASSEWEAGLRGVLYREIRNNRSFKRIGLGVFALHEYEEKKDLELIEHNPIRMHSYIEGMLIELGNCDGYATYCADPSAQYRPGVSISELATLKGFPEFTYPEIVNVTRNIDVLWFSQPGYKFPQKAFEVVDSIGTLGDSLSRLFQLKAFETEFVIAIPEKHMKKVEAMLGREPYSQYKERFTIRLYEDIKISHQKRLDAEKYKI